MDSEEPQAASSKNLDKGKFKIHNLMPSLERTYLPIGSKIGKYRILEEIDRGGMAVVYKVLQLDLDREVALKVLPANITINSSFVDRFLSEAHAVAKLNHPNIVNIHEVAVENNVYFLAMDYIPGANLYYYLNYQKPKLVDVLEITAKLADALAYAHNQKIVHRDLKLNNVIMRDNVTPVLIDFGLAKALEGDDGTITKTGEIMGSPAYMAPERLFGKNADARSDICSVGIMLYEMLTFKNPYLDPRSIHQTTMNVIEANPIPPRKLVMWLPPEIEAITLKAMHKDPDRRYQTMEELALDIRRYQKGEQVLANPPSILSKTRHFAKKHWPLIVISTLICLFAAYYSYTSYLQSEKERPYWQSMYEKRFSDQIIGDEWTQFPQSKKQENQWVVKNGALQSPNNSSYIKLDRTITRDTRVEFNIQGVENNFYNAGFFLYGTCPDSGYSFHFFKGAKSECGLTYSGRSLLFSEYNPLSLPTSKRMHVSIERKENILTFKIDDNVVSKVYDFFPPLGRDHQSLGFFVNGCAVLIDDIKIYRYAIPILPLPTLIPDRFVERGDFNAAIEEYRELLLETTYPDMVQNLLQKIAECYIRLNEFSKAKDILTSPELTHSSENTLFKTLYLSGIISERMQHTGAADSAFLRIGNALNSHPFFLSGMSLMLMDIDDNISNNNLDYVEKKIVFLTQNFPKFSHALGMLHIKIMENFIERGILDSAITIGQKILSLHPEDSDILCHARVNLSELYMTKQKKNLAVDVLNQCVASYVPSVAMWQAWMELAAIYRYNANYNDAYTTYRKVYEDCPKNLAIKWFARLKMAEISPFTSTDETPKAVFEDIIKSQHPFVAPRLIAQYYLGLVPKEALSSLWEELNPDDNSYLLCFANKALLDHQKDMAIEFLSVFEETASPSSWLLMQTAMQHIAVGKLK